MPVNYKNSSPYFTTPQRNFLIEFLDLIKFQNIPVDLTDEIVEITSKFDKRPDLMSNALYNTPDLWWIFAMRNPDLLIDPIFDFKVGNEILVPTKSRLFNLLGL